MSIFAVSEAARQLNCRPRDISDAFYARELDESCCVRNGGRRMIPAEYLPKVREVLERKGKLRNPVT